MIYFLLILTFKLVHPSAWVDTSSCKSFINHSESDCNRQPKKQGLHFTSISSSPIIGSFLILLSSSFFCLNPRAPVWPKKNLLSKPKTELHAIFHFILLTLSAFHSQHAILKLMIPGLLYSAFRFKIEYRLKSQLLSLLCCYFPCNWNQQTARSLVVVFCTHLF